MLPPNDVVKLPNQPNFFGAMKRDRGCILGGKWWINKIIKYLIICRVLLIGPLYGDGGSAGFILM